MAHVLDISAIRRDLEARGFGVPITYFEETTSTNDEARRAVRQNGADATRSVTDGLVVLAEYQTGGRGRLGRIWQAPRGASVLCSVVLIEPATAGAGDEMMLLAAVAACDAIIDATEVRPSVKWPNDLMVRGRKVAGILIESCPLEDGSRAFLCGFGINCLQQRGHFGPALEPSATSLDLESALPVDRNRVVASLLSALFTWRRAECTALREGWLKRCEPLGQRLVLRHNGRTYSGTAIDIDPSAALIVELDDGVRRAFRAGDTTVLSANV